jgi:hypothetical protein
MPKYIAVCFAEGYLSPLCDDPTQALKELEDEYGEIEYMSTVNLFKIEGEVPFETDKTFVFNAIRKL